MSRRPGWAVPGAGRAGAADAAGGAPAAAAVPERAAVAGAVAVRSPAPVLDDALLVLDGAGTVTAARPSAPAG